ncbi:MAG TPA: glycoside hydrolase family 2 TIM barrel-domain containing protein [Pirellulales bacterium]|nr:glycoside hydrolase family 2 TIM barrel-domain containing protein [Pirellulales bacterium]
MRSTLLSLIIAIALPLTAVGEWQPAKGPLKTRWAKDVKADRPLPEYPRPQMVRESWQNLNGLWEYAIVPKDAPRPEQFDGEILVPFPVESALSGVMKRVGPDQRLWYRRKFKLGDGWSGQQVRLHFGAVDWDTKVWVNGKEIGDHRGGYDPFSFNITPALAGAEQHEIVVSVWDPSDAGPQPRGKQVNKPGGIFYTPNTGIWQTVWLEPVPAAHVTSLKIVPDLDGKQVKVTALCSKDAADKRVTVKVNGASAGSEKATLKSVSASGRPGEELTVPLATVRAWSPEEPWLYDLTVTLGDPDKPADQVTSYFGLRKVSLGKDENGVTRLFLNDKPLFMFGPLDQGFWPDGIYTAPTDEALRYDVEVTRKIGFNMCRKHVKVEPARWYYWCDKLGLLVWQDMPSGDQSVALGKGEIERSPESARIYERELKAMIDALQNVPSVVMWVVFNEGWGQFDTQRITEWTKSYDPTRLVNCASGWNDFPVGDVHDIHSYPAPNSPQPEPQRAAVLGEYGGLGLPLKGHTWLSEKNWGYRNYADEKALAEAYFGLIFGLRQLIGEPGLSAAVYTQTTDVETEVNGLMTYDREILKIPAERLAASHRRLYQPPPKLLAVVPTSQETANDWRYTTSDPPDGWMKSGFDDSSWRLAPAGFGTKGTPGAVVRTEWSTPDIWLRQTFDLPESAAGEGLLNDPHLTVHHDEDAEIYLNGVLAAKLPGYTVGYGAFPMREEARAALRPGKNLMSVHCKQTGGGQYIDVGIVDVIDTPRGSETSRKASSTR